MALLRVVKAAQRLGFTLDEVAELLDPRRRHPAPDLQDRARAKLVEVDQRMADPARIREELVQVIDTRRDSLTNCACTDYPLPFIELATLQERSS